MVYDNLKFQHTNTRELLKIVKHCYKRFTTRINKKNSFINSSLFYLIIQFDLVINTISNMLRKNVVSYSSCL